MQSWWNEGMETILRRVFGNFEGMYPCLSCARIISSREAGRRVSNICRNCRRDIPANIDVFRSKRCNYPHWRGPGIRNQRFSRTTNHRHSCEDGSGAAKSFSWWVNTFTRWSSNNSHGRVEETSKSRSWDHKSSHRYGRYGALPSSVYLIAILITFLKVSISIRTRPPRSYTLSYSVLSSIIGRKLFTSWRKIRTSPYSKRGSIRFQRMVSMYHQSKPTTCANIVVGSSENISRRSPK